MKQNKELKAGCEACSMTGWILSEKEDGRMEARPCTCLYEIAKKAVEEEPDKKKAGLRLNAEAIVKAYERHREKD